MLDTVQSATIPERPTPGEKAMPPEKRDYYKWAAGIALPVVLALIPLLKHSDEAKAGNFSYSNNVTLIENQYQQIMGHPLTDENIKAQLTAAMNLAKAGRYNASLQMLEGLANAVPVPAVFTSIGSFYANQGNSQAARQFFDKAVAKDPTYEPALRNLTALATEKPSAGSISGGREVEPNNDLLHPNLLPVGATVSAEISDQGDADFFKFKTGEAPRDLYRISLKNQSTTLAARFRLFDSMKGAMDIGYGVHGTAGADVEYAFSPAANSEYYVEISGDSDSTGGYALTVQPQHAFDRFEPNDEPRYAKRITLGEAVDANIMDAWDKDVYQVKSSGAGKLVITVKNTSPALQPHLDLYDSNRGSITLNYGGWIYATAGADLNYTYEQAAPNTVYYVQISGAGGSAGTYTLTVK